MISEKWFLDQGMADLIRPCGCRARGQKFHLKPVLLIFMNYLLPNPSLRLRATANCSLQSCLGRIWRYIYPVETGMRHWIRVVTTSNPIDSKLINSIASCRKANPLQRRLGLPVAHLSNLLRSSWAKDSTMFQNHWTWRALASYPVQYSVFRIQSWNVDLFGPLMSEESSSGLKCLYWIWSRQFHGILLTNFWICGCQQGIWKRSPIYSYLLFSFPTMFELLALNWYQFCAVDIVSSSRKCKQGITLINSPFRNPLWEAKIPCQNRVPNRGNSVVFQASTLEGI